MKIGQRIMPLLILSIFWGMIGISMLTGIWQTKVDAESITVSGANDLKGWMTVADVSGYLKLSETEILKILSLPEDVDRKERLKVLAEKNDSSMEEYKELLDSYLVSSKGEAGEVSAVSSQIAPDIVINPKEPTGKVEQQSTSEANVGQSGNTQVPEIGGDQKTSLSESSSGDRKPGTLKQSSTSAHELAGNGDQQEIKGRMSLKEVESLTQVPAEYICSKLGIPDSVDQSSPLRDLAQDYNFEVDQIREIVKEYKP